MLHFNAMTTIETPTEVTTLKDCPLCGAPLDAANPVECTQCDWVAGYRQRQQKALNPRVGRDRAAAVMSVIPGLGHIYKGHRLLGAALMAGTLLIVFFCCATVSATVGAVLLLIPVYWSAVMLHAFWAEDRSAKKAAPVKQDAV